VAKKGETVESVPSFFAYHDHKELECISESGGLTKSKFRSERGPRGVCN